MNKEITILELFNSYAKPIKQPRKIKYRNKIYVYDGNAVLGQLINEYQGNIIALLNEKVEILEEDKPIIEKIEIEEDFVCNKYIENEHGARCHIKSHDKIIIDKLNEIIEFLNDKFNN